MTRTAFLTVLLFAAASPGWAGGFSIQDEGAFASTGRRVEFADRFGWRTYQARFDFGLEPSGRGLSEDSALTVTIRRADGTKWEHRCRNKVAGEMTARVHNIYGRGALVTVECRVEPSRFAKAVGLEEDIVGRPVFVFQATVKDREAKAGTMKGFYFTPAALMDEGEMRPYANRTGDPSDLAVLFATRTLYPYHPHILAGPRFVP